MTLIEKIKSLGYEEKTANGLILSGKVLVNNEKITSIKYTIKDTDLIRIKENKEWVSRGAFKLLHAINKWDINIKDKVCLDVGSSTGGFTEVLLKNNAKLIYSLDVGTNQLDYKLRNNEKIIVMEKTNLKSINKKMFNSSIDFICCDVSFISVKRLFDVINKENILSTKNELIILIKPQFEALSNIVETGGFVNQKYHNEIIENIVNYAKSLNFQLVDLDQSPIKGNISNNIEYLAYFKYQSKK